MALNIYTPEKDRIVHNVRVDMTQRTMIQKPIHLIQYDDKLPVVAVELYKDGQPYRVAADYTAAVRWGRHMESGCYNKILGADSTFHTIYFEVSQTMAAVAGASEFVIELLHDGRIGYTGPAATDVHTNPVSENDVEVQPEYTAILEYVAMAEAYAGRAEAAVGQAESFRDETGEIRDNAAEIRDETLSIKMATIEAVTDLKDETIGYRDDAREAKEEAEASVDKIEGFAKEAESYAKGGTGTREGEDTDNSKYYSEVAAQLDDDAKDILQQAIYIMNALPSKITGTTFLVDPASGVIYFNQESKFEFMIDTATGEILYRVKEA